MSLPARESEEAAKARRRRSIAIAVALGAFVILVFAVTLARMGSHVPIQP
jgi:sugar phosphate isomerase/epimerase